MDEVQATVRAARAKDALHQPVGRAPIFLKSIEHLVVIAQNDAPVLITGETGTGKGLIAGSIHHGGRRTARPFVSFNCGSVPETLFEDALFGHVAGAFTDAKRDKKDLLVAANGGTLFLDELQALSLRGQATLLHVFDNGTFYVVGATRETVVDVRFIAAINVPPLSLVKMGQLRLDLYHRLNVLWTCPDFVDG